MQILSRVLRAERHELPALAWSFAYFFLLLASYYLAGARAALGSPFLLGICAFLLCFLPRSTSSSTR